MKNVIHAKRHLEAGPGQDGEVREDVEAKRRRVLEETRDIDAESDGSSSACSEEDRWVTPRKSVPRLRQISISEEEDEDETAELLRELEKIKRERAEQRAQQVGAMNVQRS